LLEEEEEEEENEIKLIYVLNIDDDFHKELTD
jgi:hypothetical protein